MDCIIGLAAFLIRLARNEKVGLQYRVGVRAASIALRGTISPCQTSRTSHTGKMSMRDYSFSAFVVSAFVLVGSTLAHAQSGACCLGDGTCIATDLLGCGAVVGDYAGDTTDCGSTNCTGACCLAENTCTTQTRDDCESMAGTYQGPATTCELHCAAPLPPIFTYQGQLKKLGRPVDGLIDIQLSLWTTAKGGDQVGATLALFDTTIKNGLFSVPVNFPAALFDGSNRWLEVDVRSPTWDGNGPEPAYTTLSPRQLVTYAPQALQTRGMHVDDAGNIAVGHTSPEALLHLRGINNPTVKIQSLDDSEKSGRLSLRASNDHGMDMYYDRSGNPGMTFETVFFGIPNQKVLKIHRSLPGNQDRVEVGGRLRLRLYDFDQSGSSTNLVIGHALATAPLPNPVKMFIDYTKSGGTEASVRIEFNGDADPISHHGDLRMYTRSITDVEVVERMRITEDGRIGISTADPAARLHVVGQVRSTGVDGGAFIAFDPNDQLSSVGLSWLNDVARIRVGGSGPAAGGGFDIQTQGDRSLMRLLHSGNVGIGTTNPQSLLQVGEGDEASIRLGLNPQLVLSRDVANQKFRIQLTGSGYSGNVLQLGRDDGTHEILLSGAIKARNRFHSVNSSGETRVKMGMSLNGDHGAIQVYDSTGGEIVKIAHSGSIGGQVSGAITVRGPSSANVSIGASGTNVNNGLVTVQNASGQAKAGMFVNALGQGEIFGDVKSFRVTNPRDPSTDIWYASLEGPEAGAYHRGTATLQGGRASITLPEHFSDVCSHTSLTVHLTPRSASSKGLAFTDVQGGAIIVEELQNGTGSYTFDYLLIDVRAGHEQFEVIRPALNGSSDTTASDNSHTMAAASQSATKSPDPQLKTDPGYRIEVHSPPASNSATKQTASLLQRIERLESIVARQAGSVQGAKR
jgi:hypothetical protein